MRSLLLAMILAAPPALAEPVTGEEAERQLFATRGMGLAISSALGEADRKIIAAMPSQSEAAGQAFRYYGSIAFSPSEGLQSDSIQGAFNFHVIEAADAAALTACEAAKSKGAAACIVAARILPRDWERRPLQLSHEATDALRRVYSRARGPKAFAISRTNGAWSLARGAEAGAEAVADCNANAAALGGARDCTLAVEN